MNQYATIELSNYVNIRFLNTRDSLQSKRNVKGANSN